MGRDATGLLLLTNEIGWIHPLTHPSFAHTKRYEVTVEGIVERNMLETLNGGLSLTDEPRTPPDSMVKAILLDTDTRAQLSILDLELQELRPMQMHCMLENIGHPIVKTKRTAFATVKLSNLQRGQWRELSPLEINTLKLSCGEIACANRH